jgi:hypothetical protein
MTGLLLVPKEMARRQARLKVLYAPLLMLTPSALCPRLLLFAAELARDFSSSADYSH